MTNYIWIVDNGEPVRISLDELDPDVLPQVLRPVYSFCYEGNIFCDLPLTEADHYIKDWLPKQGKMMLYAPAKSGKSFLAVQLARCIAHGEPFLGMPTSQGKTLYLQFEMGTKGLQRRMQATGKDYDNVLVGTSFSLKLDTEDSRDLFTNILDSIEPQVVILDPFYKILTGDENEVEDVRKILDFLDSSIEAFNCSIVIIHHSGKDIGRGGRGSSVLEGWVDSYVEIKKTSSKGEPLKIAVTPKLLRHAALPPDPTEAVLNNGEFQVVVPDTVESRIKEVIRSQETVEAEKLIEDGVASRTATYNTLSKLVSDGVVVKVSKGIYKRVEVGDL